MQNPYHGSGVTARALQMVTNTEMDFLLDALHRGHLPADLTDKLDSLRDNDLRELYLKQQSRIVGRMLLSIAAGKYKEAGPHEGDRFLRMLAYVRKDEDAIPDTWPGGMADDYDLMRMTCTEFREALEKFKAWHLSRHVPHLWRDAASGTLGKVGSLGT